MTQRKHAAGAVFVAVLTGVLGAGSLVLFGVFLLSGAFGLVKLGLGDRNALLLDAALSLVFFLQHSMMVRRSFRARLGRVLPDNTHGVVYTLASAVALLLLVGLWQRTTASIYAAAGATWVLIAAVLALCFAGVLWGIRSLREFDAFGIQAFLSRARPDEAPPPKLAIAGPYRFIRHPFYAFGIVAFWAAPELSLDRLLLNCAFTGWIVLGAVLEERDLVSVFGEEYRRYQRTVPMFLPRV